MKDGEEQEMKDAIGLIKDIEEQEIKDITDLGDFFNTVVAHCTAELVKAGIEEKEAGRIVLNLTAELCYTYRGQTFYVTQKPASLIKHLSIYRDLKTMPNKDVDRKYRVSVGYSLRVKRQIDTLIKRRESLHNEQYLTLLL